ncbi:hypothetical protein O0I10_002336 [Lichtheimia ornata]|uniref:Kinesin motor domain-containing protein n=1 Tax=Lichtheimia ornata TaxID=688661 RepID=A0AAD7VAQ1_9FUNG|nr:uncharacterized protein O0I10_002336 [Lichtheimia ornata]KAJ8662005.1 hypothetical protein O0I10_002336 [Lichtheimia ornata]
MMMRPKSLHLPSAPQPTYSTSILQLHHNNQQQQNVPVSPPSTPLVPNSPESLSSPPLYPSPTSSTVRPTSSTSTTAIKENVQVMVRLRPPSTKEREADENPCWLVGPENGMIRTYDDSRRNPGIYQYDAVVSGSDNQSVYDTGIGDLVKSTMAGYNGTVFAYGQTASGKTYTMVRNSNPRFLF